ncbi:MAG TPA: ATP-binding protein [Methylomirabilota bacterium]|jgi:two-component system sensor histidine kinase AtoS|nr:ATP-binding protein [Methylomirabilota bacterium]
MSRLLRASPPFVSLQAKFLAGTVLVITLVMAVFIGVVERRQRATIIEEMQQRGLVVARNLAAISSSPLLLYNFTALEQNVTQVDRDPDVEYAIVLDAEGKVAASSESAGEVGALLDDPVSRRAVAASGPLVQERVVTKTGESFYDFAMPIEVQGQRWGTVRVGLSKRRVEAQIARTRWELAGLAAVVLVAGALASALVARRIARPVRQLADGAAAISRGELAQRIESVTSDEIGQLALAFNHMASQLLQQRTALEAAHAELERRFAELSDLKSYTDHILGSLTSGIVTLDLDGQIVTLNAAAEALTGCRLAEVRGRRFTEVFGPVSELGDALAQTLTSGVGGGLVSASLIRHDGVAIPVELTTAPLRGAEGKDLGVVAVLRDLTSVRQLEEQLRRSDRLAALGTLAAGLAHEIKNPLTSVLTFSRHLARRFADERFRQRFQNVVPRELERINGIVESLLRLARPARLILGPVNLVELCEQALELYANQVEAKPITVAREYAPGLPAIQADREQLYQALVNLVANALDAMPEGGTLTLRASAADPVDPFAAPGRWVRDRRVVVEIEDTGVGIAPDQAHHVFNPFFTTKPSGTGLGLALVHKIVEDHAGSVSFRSGPAGGTTFTVTLPVAGAARPVGRAGDGAPPLGQPRLLS